MAKKEQDRDVRLVIAAIVNAEEAGKRAGKMEQQRNRALQKWGLAKKALRALRKVHLAATSDNVRLMQENAILRQRLEAFEAANAVKIQAAVKAAIEEAQVIEVKGESIAPQPAQDQPLKVTA